MTVSDEQVEAAARAGAIAQWGGDEYWEDLVTMMRAALTAAADVAERGTQFSLQPRRSGKEIVERSSASMSEAWESGTRKEKIEGSYLDGIR